MTETITHNRIVAHFTDGRILKGTTHDFARTKDAFHLIPLEPGAARVRITIGELKALFFVRDLAGNSKYVEGKQFDKPMTGRKVQITFSDGEVMVGTTQGYSEERPAFFISPADPKSNNDRVYVVMKAVKEVSFIK